MNCPNCNTPYDPESRYCPKCGHPLGDAEYTPLTDETYRSRKRTGKILRIIMAVILICTVTLAVVYFVYIQIIKHYCRDATERIFTVAHDMDFSSVDPSLLPEELQENPDISSLIQSIISESLGDSEMAKTISRYVSQVIDTDKICEDIVSSASYEILSEKADYHTCRVTVRTENTDYSKVLASVYSEIQEMVTDTDSLWESIGSFFSSIFGGESKTDQTDLTDTITSIYKRAKEETETVSYTGTIEFGIRDGSWTVTGLDKKLFYTYYGISSFME